MKHDVFRRVLLVAIAVLLSLNLLVWIRSTTAAAAQPHISYKMLAIPTNADGIRTFESETNQNGYRLEALQIGGQEHNLAVVVLKK